MSLSVVEGWTERIKYTLTADGATVNLTGMSVTLLLYDVTKTLFSYSGTSGVDTASILAILSTLEAAWTDLAQQCPEQDRSRLVLPAQGTRLNAGGSSPPPFCFARLSERTPVFPSYSIHMPREWL